MTEYLRINNFGPIEEVEIENVAPFTILVGESGSGKSTVLKVISLFRWIYKRIVLRSYVKQAGIDKTGIGIQIKTLLKTSGLDDYLKPSTEIIYMRDDYEISFRNKKLNVQASLPFSRLSLEKICFISDKRAMVPDFMDNRVERKVANYHLQDTLDNYKLATETIGEFSIDYLDVHFNVVKSSAGVKHVISGSGDKKYTIKLKHASSGTQTVVPLNLIVEYYSRHFDPQESMNTSLFRYLQDNDKLADFNTAKNIGEIEKKNVHIIIEEPELSLYPESQCRLIDFLVDRCFVHRPSYNMTLMMATHSPYIVNYINLLLCRGQHDNQAGIINLKPSEIGMYHIVEGQAVPLNIVSDGTAIVDTRLMSDTISQIYQEYNSIK